MQRGTRICSGTCSARILTTIVRSSAVIHRLVDATLTVVVKTFDDYQSFAPKNNVKQGHLFDPYMPVAEVRSKLDQIKGHLVWMPLDFLRDAEMAERGLTLNAYTESVYT